MSDAYLAEELEQEYAEKMPVNVHGSQRSQNLHKRISTHLLTVLTTSVIVSIEHEKSMFIKQHYDIWDIIVTDEQL